MAMSMDLPNPETKIPKANMANTRAEMEELVAQGLERLNLVRGQEAFYLPLDWYDIGVKT